VSREPLFGGRAGGGQSAAALGLPHPGSDRVIQPRLPTVQ